MSVEEKLEALRKRAKNLRTRKKTVEYGGMKFDVHEPTYSVAEELTDQDQAEGALTLVKRCVTAEGSRDRIWGDEHTEDLKEMPLDMIKVLSDAASSFLLNETEAEELTGN